MHTKITIIKRLLQQLSTSTSIVKGLWDVMLGAPVNGTRSMVTKTWRPFNWPSVSTPVERSSSPDITGKDSESPGNRRKISHLIGNMQCRRESNQISRTTVRGLFTAPFVVVSSFSSSCSEIGANVKLGTRHICPRKPGLIKLNHWFSRGIIH